MSTGTIASNKIASNKDVKGENDVKAAEAVGARLVALNEMTYDALRIEWRRLYRQEPPKRVSRDLLILGVAWKIQEQAYGGLSATSKRRLAELARDLDRDGDIARARIERLKPGAKLIREWQGESHRVTVLEEGFEWRGERWRSLSVIAREITGTHWSGPRFFGLNANTEAGASARESAGA